MNELEEEVKINENNKIKQMGNSQKSAQLDK